MRISNLISATLAALMCLGCCERSENINPDSLSFQMNDERCSFIGKEARDAVVKKRGTIGYVRSTNQFYISFTPEGTYDTVIYGFVCNIPEKLKKPGIQIFFSGKYYTYPDSLIPIFPGQEYYNLDLIEYYF